MSTLQGSFYNFKCIGQISFSSNYVPESPIILENYVKISKNQSKNSNIFGVLRELFLMPSERDKSGLIFSRLKNKTNLVRI